MADKKKGIIRAEPTQQTAAGADDLTILHPHQEVTIAGAAVTVREYSFVEGLRLLPKVQPLLDDLRELLQSEQAAPLTRIQNVLAAHADLTVQLIAQSADVEIDFVNGLDQIEGTKLMTVWWAVNSAFFLRKAVDAIIAQKLAASRRGGATSTPRSSATTTAQQTSDAIPSGK